MHVKDKRKLKKLAKKKFARKPLEVKEPKPVKVYKHYNYQYDPQMVELVKLIKADGHTINSLAKESGVSAGTISNWAKKKTRRPQNFTLEATGRSIGYRREWVKDEK